MSKKNNLKIQSLKKEITDCMDRFREERNQRVDAVIEYLEQLTTDELLNNNLDYLAFCAILSAVRKNADGIKADLFGVDQDLLRDEIEEIITDID